MLVESQLKFYFSYSQETLSYLNLLIFLRDLLSKFDEKETHITKHDFLFIVTTYSITYVYIGGFLFSFETHSRY